MKTLLRYLAIFVAVAAADAQMAPPVPENLGLGLKQLVEISQRDQAELRSRFSSAPLINVDAAGRVLANVQLNGEKPIAEVRAALISLGLEITAVDEHWRSGVISVRLPLSVV